MIRENCRMYYIPLKELRCSTSISSEMVGSRVFFGLIVLPRNYKIGRNMH